MIQTQFHKSVRTLKSTRGTEFVNSECTKIFQQHGIANQQTSSYTPQQNKIVERKHESILKIA